ncbi:hypothetical protein D9M71_825090 [compost metagenome]
MVVRDSYEDRRLSGCAAGPVQAACATKSMEGEPFDLVGQKGIIVVPRSNIEHREERVASGAIARYHG